MNDRLLRTLNGDVPDQVPFLPAIYEHKGWFIGETPSRVARDARLLTTALQAEFEQVGADALIVGVDIYNVEAEAMGCTVTYYEGNDNSVPAIGSNGAIVHTAGDLESLRTPDPYKDGRMPLNLEAARNTVKTLGREVPVRGAVSGPFSLAAHLSGPGNFFLLLMMQTELVKALLAFAAGVIKAYGKALIEQGCGIVMFDSHASPDLLPPDMYRDLVLPHTREIIEYFQTLGVQHVPLIIGGNTTKMLDSYLDTGANNLLCDVKADPQRFVEACSKTRRAFRRNIDLSDAGTTTPDEAHRRALRDLEASGGYPGFILGTAVLPYGTPLSHLLAMKEAIREHSKSRGRG
ncbi:MAG TPA: uroporphyrinogen decarboxylase family protein [Bacteroidota bacterium]|nr:uroporphyrinogen decarboxylase family protein [Bacteroidota bacterium]